MKTWMTGLAILVATLGGNAAAWAGWEPYTAYRTEDIYGNVDVPTTHTVDVPDYGWVNQGAAQDRVTLATNGRVVIRSISVPELTRMANTGARGDARSGQNGSYSSNRHAGSRSTVLTGLKGREAVAANRALVSKPTTSNPGNAGGVVRGRTRAEQDSRGRDDRDDRERGNGRKDDRD